MVRSIDSEKKSERRFVSNRTPKHTHLHWTRHLCPQKPRNANIIYSMLLTESIWINRRQFSTILTGVAETTESVCDTVCERACVHVKYSKHNWHYCAYFYWHSHKPTIVIIDRGRGASLNIQRCPTLDYFAVKRVPKQAAVFFSPPNCVNSANDARSLRRIGNLLQEKRVKVRPAMKPFLFVLFNSEAVKLTSAQKSMSPKEERTPVN